MRGGHFRHHRVGFRGRHREVVWNVTHMIPPSTKTIPFCSMISSAYSIVSMVDPPGWWYTYHSEKYESRLGLLVPIYGKKCSKPPSGHLISPLYAHMFRPRSFSHIINCRTILSQPWSKQSVGDQGANPHFLVGYINRNGWNGDFWPIRVIEHVDLVG